MQKVTYLLIEKVNRWKDCFYIKRDSVEDAGEPLCYLEATDLDKNAIKITKNDVEEELYHVLSTFSCDCAFTAPMFSSELSFDELLKIALQKCSDKYLFRYFNNSAQCYDKTKQTWYNIRAERKVLDYLRIASHYGNFILAINPLAIDWMFNCDDLREND